MGGDGGTGGAGVGGGGRGRGPQLSRLKVAATAVSAPVGFWPQRAWTAMPRRDRNKVKFATWGIYLRGESSTHAAVWRKLKDGPLQTEARIPGGPSATLQVRKIDTPRGDLVAPGGVGRYLRSVLEDRFGRPLEDPSVRPRGSGGDRTDG